MTELVYTNGTELTEDELRTKEREITNLLWENQCEVTFTKVNGEVRTMPCTLQAAALPQRDANKLHETRIYNPKNISAWCLDKSEWRSFRTANVTKVTVLNAPK
jgi:WYL_2, Sm-like SH3 beta-barrel fold